jgi:hypothetical protein
MNWNTQGQLVEHVVADLRQRGITATAEQVANALKTAPGTLATAKAAVIQASRAVGRTVDVLAARAAEAKQARQLAALEADLQRTGRVAAVNDRGEVVGITSEPYFFAAEAGDHLKELKVQRNKLRAILDHPAASVDEKLHAQVDLDRVQELIRSLEEANPTGAAGMTRFALDDAHVAALKTRITELQAILDDPASTPGTQIRAAAELASVKQQLAMVPDEQQQRTDTGM